MQIRQSEFFISSVVQYAIHVSISTPLGKFVTNTQFSKFEKKTKDQFSNWRESTYISVRMYKYSHQQQATCSNGQTKERVTINIINRKWLDTLFSNADKRTLLNQFWNALHSQLQNQNHHLKRRKLHHLVLLLWVRAGKSYDDVCRNKFRLLRQSPQSAQVY